MTWRHHVKSCKTDVRICLPAGHAEVAPVSYCKAEMKCCPDDGLRSLVIHMRCREA